MIYFLVGKRVFHGGCWWEESTSIGTEMTLPAALDNQQRLWRARDGLLPGANCCGREVGPNQFTRISAKQHRMGWYHREFEIRQMEGGANEARRVYERFKHLRCNPDDIHVYFTRDELRIFIEEHTEAWTGENAAALGQAKPNRTAEDRPAPVSNGLTGRLRHRPV